MAFLAFSLMWCDQFSFWFSVMPRYFVLVQYGMVTWLMCRCVIVGVLRLRWKSMAHDLLGLNLSPHEFPHATICVTVCCSSAASCVGSFPSLPASIMFHPGGLSMPPSGVPFGILITIVSSPSVEKQVLLWR